MATIFLVSIVKFITITIIFYLLNLYSRDSLSFLGTAFAHSIYFQCPLLTCPRHGSAIMYHHTRHYLLAIAILSFKTLPGLNIFVSYVLPTTFEEENCRNYVFGQKARAKFSLFSGLTRLSRSCAIAPCFGSTESIANSPYSFCCKILVFHIDQTILTREHLNYIPLFHRWCQN